jgi:hypothetical protein
MSGAGSRPLRDGLHGCRLMHRIARYRVGADEKGRAGKNRCRTGQARKRQG